MREGEEHSVSSPFTRSEGEQVDAVESRVAVEHAVPRVSGEGVREGRLPRSVGPHDGVDLARGHRQVEALQDFLPGDLHTQT